MEQRLLDTARFSNSTHQGRKILHNFAGSSDGNSPHGKLMRDSAGNLYGTTEFGGDTSVMCQGYTGCGVVFKISPTGKETRLYKFTGGTDEPLAGLWRDSAGNLYGTTSGGGNIGCNYVAVGCGVVFKVTPTGQETVLYAFTGPNDGGYSASPVIMDWAKNLYGMTTGLGTNTFGTIFKISPAGKETVLHAFNGFDGDQPYGSLVRDSKGSGTTYGGGNVSNCYVGCGVVYEINSAGQELELYTFTGLNDGGSPEAGLTRDSAGNLYGTALLGAYGYGVIFKLTP